MSTKYPLPLASPELVGFSSERLDRLDGAMLKEIDVSHYAGISVMVARHGKLVKFRCYGFQSLEVLGQRVARRDPAALIRRYLKAGILHP